MKTKLLCYLGALLLLSGLFCSCEKEPEASVEYSTYYGFYASSKESIQPFSQKYPLLDSLCQQFHIDLFSLSTRQVWEIPTAKGHLSDGDEDAIAEFNERLLPEAEKIIDAYLHKFSALVFQEGEFLQLEIHCYLQKKVKIADMRRYSPRLREHIITSQRIRGHRPPAVEE